MGFWNAGMARRAAATFLFASVAAVSAPGCANLDSFLFVPYKVDEYELEPKTIPADRREVVSFRTGDGVTLWAALALQPDPRSKVTVLYHHGNTGNVDYYWERIGVLYSYGYNVLIYDYRGFGKSEGSPTEEGVYADARAALAYLTGRPEIDPARIVYYGVSLGGAMAIDLADRVPPKALVVESTFRSAADLAKDGSLFLPASFTTTHEFPSIEKIARVKSPVLVMHGTKDDFVQTKYGKELYAAAPDPKELVLFEGANHGDVVETNPELYRTTVTGFVGRHVP